MPLSRHNVGTYQETSPYATRQGTLGQSSQLAELLWTDPGLKSGISVRKLIATKKKKKKKKAKLCRLARQNPPPPRCVPSGTVNQSATVSKRPFCCLGC